MENTPPEKPENGLPRWVIKLLLAKMLLLIVAAGGAYLYFQSL